MTYALHKFDIRSFREFDGMHCDKVPVLNEKNR